MYSENNKKINEIASLTTDIEHYPKQVNDVNLNSYSKIPISNLATMGIALEPLSKSFMDFVLNNSGNGKPGLYQVTFDAGCKLVRKADNSGYLGAVAKSGTNQVGGGMATLTKHAPKNPLVINPAMMIVAISLMNIEKKLDNIAKVQKEIFEFLVQKEKAKLRGSLSFLSDIMENYKFNWNNDIYKNSNHIKSLDIKQESEQNILFYHEQIINKINKQSFMHFDKDVNEMINKIKSDFEDYQLALYLYAFSSFIDVILLENYRFEYLEGIVNKIMSYVSDYNNLYDVCYSHIEGNSKSSVQSRILSGIGIANKAVSSAASKIPLIKNTSIDETLNNAGNNINNFNKNRTNQTMSKLPKHQNNAIELFIDKINSIKKIHNEPMQIYFDVSYIYYKQVT